MLRSMIPLLALTACAATPQQVAREEARDAKDVAALAERLRGYTPGEPVSCIRPLGRTDVSIYGDTLVYREGNRLYRTQTSGGCFGLRRDDIIVTRTPTGQLCRGDIVTTVNRTAGFESGSCTFGDFTPYTKQRS